MGAHGRHRCGRSRAREPLESTQRRARVPRDPRRVAVRMNTSHIDETLRSRPARSRLRGLLDIDVVAVLVASIIAWSITTVLVRGPDFVDEVSVVNPSG